ncbi:MAG: T9SS C-terminal target domain-containing protein [Calditrichaeota bacterium]|nr:MAG: T9SS C-terminal target domain-containing protein [Calditrichota bacterium]MBL1207031.1 T9SS C-terminal target domain-containing protein [Calditrichota bacterium]NOG46858.1 T9SS type A sorting domain-containing protein [Calditrichota bacterium]
MRKINTLAILSFLALLTVKVFSQDFYDINTINTIEITFEESNWDYLLDQLVSEGYEARLLGTAVVNGISYDSVGVRYKGNSSYNANQIKNPLNIKLDYVIKDQEHEDYGTLKLANVYKDPSFIREALTYEIARKYMPASLSNFVKVYINGSYLGLYSSVQDVDKHFLRSNYYDDDNSFFKGEIVGGSPQSVVKIWGYFGEDSASYKNYYEIESDSGWSDLINFLDKFNNKPESIESVLNVDRHLWMLAFDNLLVNLDAPINFAHNYYLYKDDAGRFNPIIWDLNENFGVFSRLLDEGSLSTAGLQQLNPYLYLSNDNYPIINKILSDPTYKKMYVAHMKTIMADYFENGLYKTRALEIQSIIDAEVQDDPNKFYTYSNFIDNIDDGIGSGRPGPGNESIIGITELMDARITYLNSLSDFTASSPEISNIENNPTNPAANTDVWITVDVATATSVQLAYRSSLTAAFEKKEMLDDGNSNDGVAGDGIYGASISTGTNGFQYYIYAENDDAASFLPARAAYEFFTMAISGDLVINEFLASNDSSKADQDGEYDDWIELYNNTDADISLAGYYLSDDGDEITQWAFPDTFITAKGYLIVWADKDDEQEGLHANFKLSGSGETIYLVNSDTAIVGEVSYGEQTADISTGRYPNGTGAFVQMNPTFSAENYDNITSIDDDLQIELPGRFELSQNYPNPFNPTTNISFKLANPNVTSLKIYNITGQVVATLIDKQLSAGIYIMQWEAENMSSGIYFYRLTSGTHSETKRMILLK